MADPAAPHVTPTPDRPAGAYRTKGGFAIREYERRVWDMARHVIHPTFLYVIAVVAGSTRLLQHGIADTPGTGWQVELALFLAGFLGAWGCFYSTLMRDAGLASSAARLLIPLAVLGALAVWTVFPAPAAMDERTFWIAAACVVGPGPLGWAEAMLRWRSHRRQHADVLREAES